ncbi:MAG: FAD-dependent monooxygenase [Phormidesmis sp.]
MHSSSTPPNVVACDVAIIGCGPVGAIAANLLGLYGIQTIVLERELDVYHLPRAIHFDVDIMRIIQQLGLNEEMSAVVAPVSELQFLDRNRRLLFSASGTHSADEQDIDEHYVFYQPWMEEILRESMKRFECLQAYFGYAVRSITPASDGPLVTAYNSAKQQPLNIQARYLLGCDGASSITRKSLGIALQDFNFDKQWLVVDTFIKPSAVPQENTLSKSCQLLCDERRPAVYVPSVGNHHRWEFMLAGHELASQFEQLEKVRELLSDWINPNYLDIHRITVYQFHSLIAQQWRHGSIFLLGVAEFRYESEVSKALAPPRT